MAALDDRDSPVVAAAGEPLGEVGGSSKPPVHGAGGGVVRLTESEKHFHASGPSAGHLEKEVRPQAQRSRPEISEAARRPTAPPASPARALLYTAMA